VQSVLILEYFPFLLLNPGCVVDKRASQTTLFTAAAEENSKMKTSSGANARKFKVFSDPVDVDCEGNSIPNPKSKRSTEFRKSNLDKALKRAPRVSCL